MCRDVCGDANLAMLFGDVLEMVTAGDSDARVSV